MLFHTCFSRINSTYGELLIENASGFIFIIYDLRSLLHVCEKLEFFICFYSAPSLSNTGLHYPCQNK